MAKSNTNSSYEAGFAKFWSVKENRRHYHKLVKRSYQIQESSECIIFLENCLRNDIIPTSCKLKLNKSNVSEILGKQRDENIKRASITEIKLAISEKMN